jgi:hypothetical protein
MRSSSKTLTSAGLAWRFGGLVVLLLALPILLVATGARPPPVAYLWDGANLLGFLGIACMLLLLYYTGRPRAFPPFSGRFFANFHRDIGYLALAFVLAHVGFLLITEPLLVEHLKLTAPGYMLAGMGAAVLCVLLVVFSVTGLRRRLWPDYRLFRKVHGLASLLIVALALVHVIGSAFYLNHWIKLGLMSGAGGLAACNYIGGGHRRATRGKGNERLRDGVRYSRLVSYGTLLLLVGMIAAALLLHHRW